MKRLFFVFALCFGCAMAPALGAEQYWIADDLAKIASDPADSILKQHPLWAWLGVTAALYAFDKPVTQFYEDNIEPVSLRLHPDIIVNERTLFTTVIALHNISAALPDRSLMQLSYLGAESLLDSFFLSQAIKQISGRGRPRLTDGGPYNWFHFDSDMFGAYTSFPSSHATWYFSFFTIVGKTYKNEFWADVGGTLCYFSIVNHNHWSSDMWMGYLLGHAVGDFVWDHRKGSISADQWFLFPFFLEGSAIPGIGCQKMF